jgi:hypothetical protein
MRRRGANLSERRGDDERRGRPRRRSVRSNIAVDRAKGACVAIARLRSGQAPLVSFDATWSSSHPDVVVVDALGVVSGPSSGQATVSASYRDRKADVALVVTAEDALRIDSGQAHQGDFTPGSTVTMWLQGYYSVTSAENGRLSLRISDQARTVATTPPVMVAKGGTSSSSPARSLSPTTVLRSAERPSSRLAR